MSRRDATFLFREEQGSAGKVLLIIAGTLVLLGVAGWALWRPMILPLVGEAVPERAVQEQPFDIPRDDPQVRVHIPEDWVYQRELFAPERAVITTPDLELEISVDTWEHGASPTVHTALAEATEAHTDVETPRLERLGDGLVAHSVFAAGESEGERSLTVIVGVGEDQKAASLAVFTISGTQQELDTYLPALTEVLAGVEEVPQ